MSVAIEKYNPNANFKDQHIEITLMQWEYTTTRVVTVGGNCLGLTVLESAVEALYGQIEPDIEDEIAEIILINPEGYKLYCTDDELQQEDWLKEMVVSVRFVEAPATNEENPK